MQCRQRNRYENGKNLFHGDSSFYCLVSLPLSAGSDWILPVRTSFFIVQIIVFAARQIVAVARYAIRSCSISVARNASVIFRLAIERHSKYSVCAEEGLKSKIEGPSRSTPTAHLTSPSRRHFRTLLREALQRLLRANGIGARPLPLALQTRPSQPAPRAILAGRISAKRASGPPFRHTLFPAVSPLTPAHQ